MPEAASPPVYSVSWQEFDARIHELVSQLLASDIIPDCIVGIARGGCVVAVALSHAFPQSDFCVIQARIHKSDAIRAEKGAVRIQAVAGANEFNQKKVLLIDDVLHTGATARACYEFVNEYKPAAIYYAALLRDTLGVQSDPISFPFITTGSVEAWVIFPWEPQPS